MRSGRLIHTCSIYRRYKKQSLAFDGGTVALVAGRTLTGADSEATATIDVVTLSGGSWGAGTAAGTLVLSQVTGTFQNNEAITDSEDGAAVANGAPADFVNTYRESEYYWMAEQASVVCLLDFFKDTSETFEVRRAGEGGLPPLLGVFGPTVTLSEGDRRVVTTQTGFAGTYDVLEVVPALYRGGIHHFEAYLQEVLDA